MNCPSCCGQVYKELRLFHQKFETLMSEEGQPTQQWGNFILKEEMCPPSVISNEWISSWKSVSSFHKRQWKNPDSNKLTINIRGTAPPVEGAYFFLISCLANRYKTLRCWTMSRAEQWSWWRVWSTSLIRSGWGIWGCLAWRRGGWGEILCLSTTTWREGVVRWMMVSSPK